MGRDTRDSHEEYDEREDRQPPSRGSGGQRNARPRGELSPPSRPGSGPNSVNGRRTLASDPSRRANGANGSGPRSNGNGQPRREMTLGDSTSQQERRRRASDAHAGAPPPARDGRSRRSVSIMARDFSRAMSRQFGALVRGTERAARRVGESARAEPQSSYRPGLSSALVSEMSLEAAARGYRRSRIRMRARKWRLRRVPPNPIKLAVILAVAAMLSLAVMGAGGAGLVYAVSYYNQHTPQIQALAANLQGGQSTVIYDRNGQVLYTVRSDNGFNYYTPLAQISDKLQKTTLDTEDPSFYSPTNIGVDFKSVLGAIKQDTSTGAQRGGSTITQQLVKNLVLQDSTKAITRKLNEMILAVGVTLNYTKAQILEMYLNSIDYGDQNQGVEAAARNYFGLVPKAGANSSLITANQQLSWGQAALLSGLPNAPTYYLPIKYSCSATSCPDSKWDNPCTNNPRDDGCDPSQTYDYRTNGHEWLDWRRARLVLDNVLKNGDMKQSEHDAALTEVHDLLANHAVKHWSGISTGSSADTQKNAPHFVDYVIHDWLQNYFGIDPDVLPRAGLKIYTTLDLNLDNYAHDRLNHYINQSFTNYWYCPGQNPVVAPCQEDPLSGYFNAHNGAFTAVDPHTGDILAMVGSVDYGSKDPHVLGFNNITTSTSRSMGSSTKGLVYATAFQMGWYPGIMLQDSPICFPNPVPPGPDGKPAVTNKAAPACKGWYSPANYEENSFSGYAPVRPMLANSLNIPATETMSFVGSTFDTSDAFVAMTRRLGVTTITHARMGPTTALGAQEIPLLQLTGAYATFANNGMREPYRAVLRIEDHSGNVLYQAPTTPQGTQVMSPQAAYELTSILTDNQARLPDFGWYNPLYFGVQHFDTSFPGIDIAAKTGTSQGNGGPNDIVTMGYSPYLAVGVWIGNTDPNDAMTPGIIGIAGAGYVFHDVMEWAIEHYHWPAQSHFPIPAGMAIGQFNCTTGLAPYKGDKPHDCPLKPAVKGSTGLYLGLSKSPGMPGGYAGGDTYADQDWYIQGQVPLQS